MARSSPSSTSANIVDEGVGGVAHHHDKVRSGRFKTAGHICQLGANAGCVAEDGVVAIGYRGVVIDQHANVVLVALGVSRRQYLLHEVHGSSGAQSAHDARYFS